MKFRNATLEDLPAMKALYRDTILTVCRKDYTEEQVNIWSSSANKEERWLDMVVNQYVLLAGIGDELVGFATLRDHNYIDFFYVHKDFQGMGIAGELLRALIQKATEQGTMLLSSDISKTARPFFEKQGFKVVAEQENVRQDQVLINYKMIRHLPGPDLNPRLKGVVNIEHVFNITGRGLVFAGIIVDGDFGEGDRIEFRIGNSFRNRQIKSRAMIRFIEYNPLKFGMMIQCENKEELEELHAWKPFNEIALIYSSEANPS